MSKLAFCYISTRNLVCIIKAHTGGPSSPVVWDDGNGGKSLWVPQQDQWIDQSAELDRYMNILIERPCEETCKTDQDQRPVGIRAASERSEKIREAREASYTRSAAAHNKTGSSFVSKGLALRGRTRRGEG